MGGQWERSGTCLVRASVRNLFPGLVLVAPVPHVSLWARQHCPGARISPRHQAVTPGEAGPGWGRRWDCVGCARRKWLGASAVAMCTLKGSAQRLLLGSLLGESRWDFLFAPFPAPSPSSCLGPFGLQPRQRLSNTLPAVLMLGVPISGLSTPILVLSAPVPVLSTPGRGRDRADPCASQIQGQSRRALGAVRETMDQVH